MEYIAPTDRGNTSYVIDSAMEHIGPTDKDNTLLLLTRLWDLLDPQTEIIYYFIDSAMGYIGHAHYNKTRHYSYQ